MTAIPEYERGYGDAMTAAIAWLHARAEQMNDPHARSILNSAATNLGWAEASRKDEARPA